MKVLRNVVLAALLVPLATAPLSAQSWKWDIGINGGYSWFTKMLDAEENAIGGEDIKFNSGPLVGAQLGFWFTPNFGLRANARYGAPDVEASDVDTEFVQDVNLWGGTGDLLFRFVRPADEYTGMEFLPYAAVGAGLKWINPPGDDFTCFNGVAQESFACAPITVGGNTFALKEESSFLVHLGLGADWRLSRNFALRTEISDQIFKPRLYDVTGGANNSFTLVGDDESVAETVHEIAGQIGLQFLFGVPRAEVVAVAPPAPPPPPAPTPPPPPAEEAITVCVIDPTTPGGINMMSAVYIPTQGDTMVTVNGQRVLLRNAVGNVMVASNADWYVRGQPMTMMVGTERIEFVTTGTPRVVEATDLAFLGTVNGMPVYADRNEVQDVIEELNEKNRAVTGGADLAKLLEEDKDLKEDLDDLRIVYVPLQPTGCVFQAVQRQEAVRKNR